MLYHVLINSYNCMIEQLLTLSCKITPLHDFANQQSYSKHSIWRYFSTDTAACRIGTKLGGSLLCHRHQTSRYLGLRLYAAKLERSYTFGKVTISTAKEKGMAVRPHRSSLSIPFHNCLEPVFVQEAPQQHHTSKENELLCHMCHPAAFKWTSWEHMDRISAKLDWLHPKSILMVSLH